MFRRKVPGVETKTSEEPGVETKKSEEVYVYKTQAS